MLEFLILGLVWAALYNIAHKASQPTLDNAFSIIPSLMFRMGLPLIFAILCAHFSKTFGFPVYLITPTLTLSIYQFFKDLLGKNESQVNTFLSRLLSKNSFFIRHYDILVFYPALAVFLVLFGVK